jgi:pimeloyl-ACP methyl ester carboxylesterase
MDSMFLEVPGGRLAYDDTGGAGRLVVCVPGIGDVRALYRFFRPALVEAGYRVVTVDLRGHGESTVGWPEYTVPAVGADILALVRHLDAGPAVVVGESMAAAAGIWAAAEAPDQVAALLLTGPATRDAKLNPLMRFAAALAGRLRWMWLTYLASLYPTRKPEDFGTYKKELSANLGQHGRMAALRGLIAAPKAPARARIGEVHCPVLVVMGTKDADFKDPAAEARSLAAELSGEAVLIEGAGHYPQAEFPAETVAAVLPFLATVAHA